MAKKTSDWKIVATEGATVDGRTISPQWINDMASAYSHDEYVALIWPEHSRSQWGGFSGKNWGVVEEIKAEKRSGKLRLLAKITPNEHLLKANKEGQKLFTSIEPNPDYKGQGTCYLQGLAVTDSPASSGTTLLKFSTGSEEKTLEASQLEEINFSECVALQNPIKAAVSTLYKFFQSGGELPEINPEIEEDEPMKPEQFSQMMDKLNGIENKQTELESAQEALAGKVDKFSIKPDENVPAEKPESEEFSVQQFSQELEKQLKPITDKVNGLETQFKKLSQEVPGQRPGEEGAGETKVEAY
jgi:hypothetical protein